MLEFLINRTWAIELPLAHFFHGSYLLNISKTELVSAVEKKRTSIIKSRSTEIGVELKHNVSFCLVKK